MKSTLSVILALVILCFLLQGAGGISTTLSTNGNGKDAAIAESLSSGTGVGLAITNTAGIGSGALILAQRNIYGSGKSDLLQSFGGDGYSATNSFSTKEGSTISSATSAMVSPELFQIEQRDDVIGGGDMQLYGVHGKQIVSQQTSSAAGELSSSQGMMIDGSITAFQKVDASDDRDESWFMGNDRGDFVLVDATVRGGESTYSKKLVANKDYVSATESLKVKYANTVSCNGNAINAEGEWAWVGASLARGGITYSNSVRAGTTGSTATQKINANGELILAGAESDQRDYGYGTDGVEAKFTSKIEDGSLSSTIGASSTGIASGRSVYQAGAKGSGSLVNFKYSSIGGPSLDDQSSIEEQVIKGSLASAGKATAKSSSTSATDKYSASGYFAEKTCYSKGANNAASTTAHVLSGSMSSTDTATATNVEATASDVKFSAKGDKIGYTAHSVNLAYPIAFSKSDARTELGSFGTTSKAEAKASSYRASGSHSMSGEQLSVSSAASGGYGLASTGGFVTSGKLTSTYNLECLSDGNRASQSFDGAGVYVNMNTVSSFTTGGASSTQGSAYRGAIKSTERAENLLGSAVSYSKMSGTGMIVTSDSTVTNSETALEATYFDGSVYGTGFAEFAVKAKKSLKSEITGTATTTDVRIAPTTSAAKTAIILEPFKTDFTGYWQSADMHDTAFKSLVDSGYAVLRYTDSAATKDKYQDLDSYNLVLLMGHMNPSTMGLSTSPSEISAAELNSIYNRPPSSSMVILGGCMSFSGAPESQSPLAQAVSEATVRGGYPEEVLKTWLQDSTAVFFQKMAEGMTAGQANDYVWDVYRPKWLVERGISEDNKNVVHLEFFGDEDFSL